MKELRDAPVGASLCYLVSTLNTDLIKFLKDMINGSSVFSAPALSITACPWCIINSLSPYSTAKRRLWVTIMVVRFFSRTTLLVSSMIVSAVFGSRAAVCSSRIRNSIGVIVDIKSAIAWRCPPERTPTLRPFYLPVQGQGSGEIRGRIPGAVVGSRTEIEGFALLSAKAMFSAMVIEGQVPIDGFW